MDEQYRKECTKNWNLIEKEGLIELWSYKDLVEWTENYCIKVNGIVKVVLEDDMRINPYTAFEMAKQLLN